MLKVSHYGPDPNEPIQLELDGFDRDATITLSCDLAETIADACVIMTERSPALVRGCECDFFGGIARVCLHAGDGEEIGPEEGRITIRRGGDADALIDILFNGRVSAAMNSMDAKIFQLFVRQAVDSAKGNFQEEEDTIEVAELSHGPRKILPSSSSEPLPTGCVNSEGLD